jgi:hypothetical protein
VLLRLNCGSLKREIVAGDPAKTEPAARARFIIALPDRSIAPFLFDERQFTPPMLEQMG